MPSISAKEFFFWEQKQLSKGGDKQSLYLLLDTVGGIAHEEINSIKLNQDSYLYSKINLTSIESIWDNHVVNLVPIQYLCGFTFWRDLKLIVSEDVLIPRPETEIIIDIILEIFNKDKEKLLFAELGTGSGAISISLALKKPFWEGIATDIDSNSIKIALKNFLRYSSRSNLQFCCGHWFKPLKDFKKKLDLIISNPPYIPKEIYKNLPKQVINFEPEIALIGGEDGLEHIREIIQNAPFFLKERGWLIIENHYDQGTNVKKLFLENRFTSVKVLKDYSGVGRFTIGRYK